MGDPTAMLLSSLDDVFIWLFRLTGIGVLDYLLGLFFVASISVLLGELSIWLAYLLNLNYIKNYSKLMEEKELLAFEAQKRGDSLAYRGLNEEATEYWGRHFFLTSAISIGSLWPIPFAIYWLGLRFEEVKLPVAQPLSHIFPNGIGYITLYAAMYVLARVVIKHLVFGSKFGKIFGH